MILGEKHVGSPHTNAVPTARAIDLRFSAAAGDSDERRRRVRRVATSARRGNATAKGEQFGLHCGVSTCRIMSAAALQQIAAAMNRACRFVPENTQIFEE
jgi:hypothetical protein